MVRTVLDGSCKKSVEYLWMVYNPGPDLLHPANTVKSVMIISVNITASISDNFMSES